MSNGLTSRATAAVLLLIFLPHWLIAANSAGLGCLSISPISVPASSPDELTPEEIEFDALCSQMKEAFNKFYAEREAISDPMEKAQFEKENDPQAEYFNRLAEFEVRHRGSHVGLMAVYQLSVRHGLPGEPGFDARRKAIQLAPYYHHLDEFNLAIRFLGSGSPDAATKTAFESAIASPNISLVNRDLAKFLYAEWIFDLREGKRILNGRLEALRQDEPQNAEQIRYWENWLAQINSIEDLDALEKRAAELLEEVANSNHGFRLRTLRSSEKSQFILRIDREATSHQPLISESAERLLHKSRFLLPGREMADFEVTLHDGSKWRLQNQRGRVVIIQFSFVGCGPCARMYPELSEVQQKYGDKVSVLTIMQDPPESVAEAIKTHAMSWSVCADGNPSPLVSQWSVVGFPTVYVVAPDGIIIDHDPLSVSYDERVAQLLDR
jgi:peroxiredoxin